MPKLFATLRETITTGDEVILKGTPVQVMGLALKKDEWNGNVLVKAGAYIYNEEMPADLTGWDGNVSSGIYLEVLPQDLLFLKYVNELGEES